MAPSSANSDPALLGKRPVCILAIKSDQPQKKLESDLSEEGITLKLINNQDQMLEVVSAPECFCIFVDKDFHNNVEGVVQTCKMLNTNAFIVLLSPQLNRSQSSALFSAGVFDILTKPVHPIQIKGRARMILGRYLKTHTFPSDVILPSWYSAPQEKREDGVFGVAEAPNMKMIKGDSERIDDSGLKIFDRDKGREIGHRKSANIVYDEARSTVSQALVLEAKAVREEIQKQIKPLQKKLEYDVSQWPSLIGKHRELFSSKNQSLQLLTENFSSLFLDCYSLFRAKRMTLISVGEDPEPVDDTPVVFYSLVSDDKGPKQNAAIEHYFLPAVAETKLQKKPLFLPVAQPSKIADLQRDAAWLIDGKGESGSVLIPLESHKGVFSVVFIQLGEFHGLKEDSEILKQGYFYFNKLSDSARRLDFLCRTYRSMQLIE